MISSDIAAWPENIKHNVGFRAQDYNTKKLNNCCSSIVKEKVHLNALDPFLMEVENNINEFEKIQVTCIE